MQLSINSITLLGKVLNQTVENKTGEEGKEVSVPRRMNAEDSAQRRHFYNNTELVVKKYYQEYNDAVMIFNNTLKIAREEEETKDPQTGIEDAETFIKRIDFVLNSREDLTKLRTELNEVISESKKELHEVEFTDKTIAVIKKCFVDFGDKVGFQNSDDVAVVEITKVFGLENV